MSVVDGNGALRSSEQRASSGLQYNIDKGAAEEAAHRLRMGHQLKAAHPDDLTGAAKQVGSVAAGGKLVRADVADHPLFAIFEAAILQAMYGKGVRHGGNVTPFLEQPWVHYGKLHGRGFLTGQASKKLEEAASTRTGEGFETEVFGAIVYAGMSILKDRGEV